MILHNGEIIIMLLRKVGTDDYEIIEDVTRDYDTIMMIHYQ
jgi:hypothetical protein